MEASVISHGGFQQGFSTGALLRLRSDEQLLKLFREGNEEAFEVIFDRYRPRLLTYLKRMLGKSGIDAEDVLQDVFCKAYDSLRADRREIAVKPWLYRVAHNRSIDHLRRPQLDPEQVLATTRGLEIDPPTCVEQRDELRGLVASIGALPPQQRSALILREMEGLSHKQLAATLGTSVPAIKSLLVRARVGLAQQRAVAALHGGPAPVSALAKLFGLGGAGSAATAGGVAGGGACAAAGSCTAIGAFGLKTAAMVAATAVVGGGATVTASKISDRPAKSKPVVAKVDLAPKLRAVVAASASAARAAQRSAPAATKTARGPGAALTAAVPVRRQPDHSATAIGVHGGASAPDSMSEEIETTATPTTTTPSTTASTTPAPAPETVTTPTVETTVATTPTEPVAQSAASN